MNRAGLNACVKDTGDGTYITIIDFDGDDLNPQDERRRDIKTTKIAESMTVDMVSGSAQSSNLKVTKVKKQPKLYITHERLCMTLEEKSGFTSVEYERMVVCSNFGETDQLKRG